MSARPRAMGCCSSRPPPPTPEDNEAVRGPRKDIEFLSKKMIDPVEAAGEGAIHMRIGEPCDESKFEFETVDGERMKLREAYNGTFAVTESSARSDLIQEMGVKKAWVRSIIKTVMQTQNLTVSWRRDADDRLMCRRMIILAGGKVKMGNEFEVHLDEWCRLNPWDPSKLIKFDTQERAILEKSPMEGGGSNESELWFIDKDTCITTGVLKNPNGTEKVTYSKGIRVASLAEANKIRRRSTAYDGPARKTTR